MNCENLSNTKCLEKAELLKIQKPEFSIKYKPIFTHAGSDFITEKKVQTESEYQKSLRIIGFDKIASSSKK